MRHQTVPLHRWTDRGTDLAAVPTVRSANGFKPHQKFWTAPRRPANRPSRATTPEEGNTLNRTHYGIERHTWALTIQALGVTR